MNLSTAHLEVIIPGGFKVSLSLKITDPGELAELGIQLERCGIKPHTPAYMTNSQTTTPAKPATTPTPPPVKKEIIKQTPPPAPPKIATNGQQSFPPMPDFIPQNVTEIIDIDSERVGPRQETVYHGKTDDGTKIKIDKLLKQHMHTIGYDVSTWDMPEPYIRSSIIVATNTSGTIQQVQNRDDVWTWQRQGANVKEGDILCMRDADGEVTYQMVAKSKRMTIQLADGTEIENTGAMVVCVTQPPVKVDIPF